MYASDVLNTRVIESEQLVGTLAAQTCPIDGNKHVEFSNRIRSIQHHVRTESSHTGLNENMSMPPPCLAGLKLYQNARKEFDRIRQAHYNLAPTGCTAEFCQSGRATRINEPRVGRDRPILEIQQEAIGFLRECRDQGIIDNDLSLEQRIHEALAEIELTSIESLVTDVSGNQVRGRAGGVWEQTFSELEYGIRASWRNSRRCIMRSKFEQLTLCDLRHITSSQEMAETIVNGMQKAFNNGRILPTTFVFPPRHPTKRGPMLWNHQILAFAGYRLDDGSILGDPANLELTDAILKLGWKPPLVRSRWDILPLVTMADGDNPYLLDLPQELKRTVKITHPRYKKEFEKLGLRWVLAPALSRLGFDIGGNQYTASPFLGWFMDAEIGLRNLADSFRYNVLPDIVEVLQLSDNPDIPFDDQPEFMKLAALSRAQTELNFAVYYSYLHEQVTMVDTLTSSADYQKFDQERQDETGYRLPADPYWLAPPQGSLIPIWHNGAAPNYQPKPMICRHVQDPIKAWKRESCNSMQELGTQELVKRSACAARPKVLIFTCSAGISAEKMAKKLAQKLAQTISTAGLPHVVDGPKALNTLIIENVNTVDMIFVVASTTGAGEVPRNAIKFVQKNQSAKALAGAPRYSIFGNGDSTYGDTYNAAGKRIESIFESLGCRSMLDDTFTADTAITNPDWGSFNSWQENLDLALQGKKCELKLLSPPSSTDNTKFPLTRMMTAALVEVKGHKSMGMLRVTLDIGETTYSEVDHVKIITPNCEKDVEQILTKLQLQSSQDLKWHHENAYDYLSICVDLEAPFRTLKWYSELDSKIGISQEDAKGLKIKELIPSLPNSLPSNTIEAICKDMPTIRPRVFSVASSPMGARSKEIDTDTKGNLIDLIVKRNPGGRFSDRYLGQTSAEAKIRFAISSPDFWPVIEGQLPDAPLITITTGSGIGPVRAILQRRLIDAINRQNRNIFAEPTTETSVLEGLSVDTLSSAIFGSNLENGSNVSSASSSIDSTDTLDTVYTDPASDIDYFGLDVFKKRGSISVFAGFKVEDTQMVENIVQPASEAGILDMVELVPSNNKKERVQDRLLRPEVKQKLSHMLQHPDCLIFVCANENAAEATAINLSNILGVDVREKFGDRYIEEVFRC